MSESFLVPMPSEHPSQSYLDESKLQSVIGWFDFDSPNDDPLPVRDIGGKWTLTDGHTHTHTHSCVHRVSFEGGETPFRSGYG
ncbi:hypothetical protein [Haladaptatus caseinilyticus]|uniref:hypothetical protein n=1 Tax=Haladaptatus caseinilyticus TaxID=2993314 RepID=UPI00224B7C02|nr:hypothetical protein [Haladaptatus caseinilyticus]